MEFEGLKNTDELTNLVTIITELPKYSYNLLRFMCQFLNKVSQYSAGKGVSWAYTALSLKHLIDC